MTAVSKSDAAHLQEHGFCVIRDVLPADKCTDVRDRLWYAAEESERRGAPTYVQGLDPNPANVRVFNLLDLDSIFRELIVHPLALDLVRTLLGDGFIISNFTANIARPGSKSMAIHSDQGVVVPEPWLAPWSINIIWCLDDLHEANGATLYLPGSQHITRTQDLPQDTRARMKAFDAPAGSVIALDGRMWHTSGENVTPSEDRALLFGYYSADFLRPQTNWNAALSEDTKAQIVPPLFDLLGLGPAANIRTGIDLMAKTRHLTQPDT